MDEAGPYITSYYDVHRAADPNRKEQGLLLQRDTKTQLEQGFVLAGDPKRVADSIRKWSEEVGLTTISGTFYFGDIPRAPNLSLARSRLRPLWIEKRLRNPEALQPGTRMPGFFPDMKSPDK